MILFNNLEILYFFLSFQVILIVGLFYLCNVFYGFMNKLWFMILLYTLGFVLYSFNVILDLCDAYAYLFWLLAGVW